MISYGRRQLIDALRAIGLGRGDVIYVHSQLFGLGPMTEARDRQALPSIVASSIFEVLGDEGTLVVPTFTTQTAKNGEAFVLEETPGITGLLSEHVRTMSGAKRSLHPINSVAAMGPLAESICSTAGRSNYGLGSPYDLMLKLGAKAVNLGLKRLSNSWHHCVEAQYGVPYLYNKLLDIPVFANDQRVEGPFFASLRYLDFDIAYDTSRFDEILVKSGQVRTSRLGTGWISSVGSREYFDLGLELLCKDPYFFLKNPPKFRLGTIPFDGSTGARDQDIRRKDIEAAAQRKPVLDGNPSAAIGSVSS